MAMVIVTLVLGLLSVPLAAEGQQSARISRIGIVRPG